MGNKENKQNKNSKKEEKEPSMMGQRSKSETSSLSNSTFL